MVKWLQGKKTYITALAGAVYGVLIAAKVVPSEAGVWGAIASLNIAAWKAAFDKVGVTNDPATPTVDTAAIQAAVATISAAVGPKS
jgi:hypothetical protein